MTTVHSRQLAKCLAISIADGGGPAVLHQGRWPPRSDDEMAAYLDQAGYVVERATHERLAG
jgi:hypothetical protein